jgi:EAL domain-containing protein (putative c-di-GMP-specific phosphodiesterase class I)
VSINVSTRDLLDATLAATVGRLIALNKVPAKLICLEITESSFMEDPERTLGTLLEIDALGVEISIDDFGTGFSSLSYLKKLPVDELKIDRTFVMSMLDDRDDFTIVRSTIELAHNLGLRVVAEGVESEAVMDALTRIGCDLAQGYYTSKPVSRDALQAWLAASRWGVRTAARPGGRPGVAALASGHD